MRTNRQYKLVYFPLDEHSMVGSVLRHAYVAFPLALSTYPTYACPGGFQDSSATAQLDIERKSQADPGMYGIVQILRMHWCCRLDICLFDC
jgi:hypothetical protein